MKQLDMDMSKTRNYMSQLYSNDQDLNDITTIDSSDYFGYHCGADGNVLACGAYGRNSVFV